MNFGQLFTQGLTQMGYAQEYGAQQAAREADVQLKQQQVKMNNLAMMQQQQIMAGRAAMMKEQQAMLATDKAKVTDPLQAASQYDKMAQTALAYGDFQSASAYQKEGEDLRQSAAQTALVQAKQKQAVNEDAAKAAIAFKSNPTEAGYHSWVASMARAGADVSQYPATLAQFAKNPGALAAVDAASTLGETSKDIINQQQKQQEFVQKQKTQREEFAQRREDQLQQRQLVAAMHDATLQEQIQARKDRLAMEQQAQKDRQAKTALQEKGQQFTVQQKLTTAADTAIKPVLQDYQVAQSALAEISQGSSFGDKQAQQSLASLNSLLKGRATNIYYKANAGFGSLMPRLENALSRFAQGKYSEEDRKQIMDGLRFIQSAQIKQLNDQEAQLKHQVSVEGGDPGKVMLSGSFPRPPEGAKIVGVDLNGRLIIQDSEGNHGYWKGAE